MQDYKEENEKPEENGKSKFDFKIDIYIRKHSFRGKKTQVKRYRADFRKCCLSSSIVILLLCIVVVAVVLIFLLNKPTDEQTPSFVQTKLGEIRGKRVKSPQGDEVIEYLGVPFAEPPLGELRFNDPRPLRKLKSDPYEAFDVKYACIQFMDTTTFPNFPPMDMWNAPNPLNEDCLYLNLWVPGKKKKKKLTVMVWIYGGGFYGGANSLWVYDGRALTAYGDVIVVSFNYRVGSFGYLSTGDGRILGNFGMKDQVLALKWIQDNIAHFGGDPDDVTLFGESSGATSAGLHMMSPMSGHLFKRAIFESGSPDIHWGFMSKKQARERSKKFFKAVNCSDDNKILACLRKLPANSIHNHEWVDSNFLVFPWVPAVDGTFLTDTPHNILKNKNYTKKDCLFGANKDEGTFWLLALKNFNKDTESLHTNETFNETIDLIDHDLSTEWRRKIKKKYVPKDLTDGAAFRDNLDKVCGDRSFTCPTFDIANVFAQEFKEHSVYFYYLTYRASNEQWPPWMGVIHGAEIQWIFGMPLNSSRNYTREEVKFSKIVMDYWVNFAKTGNPNSPKLPEWPKYNKVEGKKTYLEMRSPEEFIVGDGLRESFCKLWAPIHLELQTSI